MILKSVRLMVKIGAQHQEIARLISAQPRSQLVFQITYGHRNGQVLGDAVQGESARDFRRGFVPVGFDDS